MTQTTDIPSGRMSRRRRLQHSARAYFYLAPTLILLLIFGYYPPLVALYRAFFEWNGATEARFVGLKHFYDMAHDEVLLASVNNMLILLVFFVTVSVLVPLFVAELIFNLKSNRMAYWYRFLFVIPVLVPVIVVLMIWQFIFDPEVGILNAIILTFGFSPPVNGWLSNPDLALYCFMIVGFPWVSGVSVLIFLAGLMGINKSLIDSAQIDGCGIVRRIFYVDLPLILGQLKVVLVMTIIMGLQGFGGQLVLTQGGPGYSTMVPGLYMFQQAFQFNRMGMACAIGLVMFVVTLVVTMFNMKFLKSEH